MKFNLPTLINRRNYNDHHKHNTRYELYVNIYILRSKFNLYGLELDLRMNKLMF
jgi:hypothetical protein